MKKGEKAGILVYLVILFIITRIISSAEELEDPMTQAQKVGMGNIIIPNPPNLRLLQGVVEDLGIQEEIMSPKEYKIVKPFLTNAPIFQAATYSIPHQLSFFITDTAMSSLTQEELYFIVGHELDHQHGSISNPANYNLESELEADLKGLYGLIYHLGGKEHISKALKITHKVLDKISSLNNGLTPCYRRHKGLLRGKEINDSIHARKEALEEYSRRIKTGTLTNSLLEGIRIQEIGVDKEISNIVVKFYVTPDYINKGYKYKKLVRLYQQEGKRWQGIWKYSETRALKTKYTSFKAPLEEMKILPAKYKVWVKLYVLDSTAKNKPLATAQGRAFFELE